MYMFQVRTWSRSKVNAERLASEINGTACLKAEDAVKNADVIVTVTSSSTPVLKKDWVKDGAHINGKT